jgi:A/G-specific adenine glycosylase
METLSPRSKARIHQTVLSWYRKNRRDFCWRRTRDPYVILVAEIMLHQTQARRVNERLPRFLKQFPTIRSLARASKPDVIRAWRGLGYNNRAVRLHELAQVVVINQRGRIPSDAELLRSLPGVGGYTANAVACFAFGKRVPIVDVNVRRVLTRVLWKTGSPHERRSISEIWDAASALLPNRNAYNWNQALLDLGATVCTARNPSCDACPVSAVCTSRRGIRSWRWSDNRQPAKREPSYRGIPQRYWRGRVVDALRNLTNGKMVRIEQLGRAINDDFQTTELRWLRGIVATLQRDSIVETRLHRRRLYVRLAHA